MVEPQSMTPMRKMLVLADMVNSMRVATVIMVVVSGLAWVWCWP